MTPEFQPVVRTIPLKVIREAQLMANHAQAPQFIYDIGNGWAIEPTRNPDRMAECVIAPRYTRRGLIA